MELAELQGELGGAKICARPTKRLGTHEITVESDLFFSPELTQVGELELALKRVTVSADHVEDWLEPGVDRSLSEYRADLKEAMSEEA